MVIDGARCYYMLSCLLLCAVEAMPCLRFSERNRPTSVRRRLSVTDAVLEKLVPGSAGLTSLINIWSPEALSRHSMLHLFSAYRASLVPDMAASFSSFSAAGTNGCLDLSRRSFSRCGDNSLSCRRCSGSEARRAKKSTAFDDKARLVG